MAREVMIPGPEVQISTRQFVLSGGSCCYHSWTRAAGERLELTCPASPVGGEAQGHVADDHCLYLNGTRIHLKRYAPARKDRDLPMDIKSFRPPQAGKAFWNRPFPFTNDSSGQSKRGVHRTRWRCRK
jgi:hypothetical protein